MPKGFVVNRIIPFLRTFFKTERACTRYLFRHPKMSFRDMIAAEQQKCSMQPSTGRRDSFPQPHGISQREQRMDESFRVKQQSSHAYCRAGLGRAVEGTPYPCIPGARAHGAPSKCRRPKKSGDCHR